jgi:hypothetical protein
MMKVRHLKFLAACLSKDWHRMAAGEAMADLTELWRHCSHNDSEIHRRIYKVGGPLVETAHRCNGCGKYFTRHYG